MSGIWAEVGQELILAIVPVFASMLIGYIVYLVKLGIQKLPANKRDFAASLARTFVVDAEQSLADSVSGPTKKQEVTSDVMSMLAHFKMHVPEKLVGGLINEAVYSMKQAQTGAVVTTHQSPMSDIGKEESK